MKISESLRQRAAQEARCMLEDVRGIGSVVIATPDGFEIAGASRRQLEPARIAAMASSMSAIGAVVSQEAQLGLCTCITVATDNGIALVSPVRRTDAELIVSVIVSADAVLAQVMYRTAACVRALEKA